MGLKGLTIIFLSLFIISCAHQKKPMQDLNVYIMLSVDWEGDTLHLPNIKAMQEFNKKFPDYPVVHFLNAAYYTKDWDLSEKEVTRRTKMALKDNDELGVHIHSWKNLMQASGVKYKAGPTFWNERKSTGRNGEPGDDVPLNIYSTEDIQKVLRFSLKKLQSQGFSSLKSFRGGGWISGPNVWAALASEGFQIESSAIPMGIIGKLYPDTYLVELNNKQWENIKITSMPYWQTKDLRQFPNNMGLADYITGEEFFKMYKKNIKHALKTGQKNIYLHFGWHQETALESIERDNLKVLNTTDRNYLDRVEKGLKLIEAHAKKNQIKLKPSSFTNYPEDLVFPSVQ